MPDITIYGLDAHDLERLQRRADANQRSLEDEIKHVLTWGVEYIERIQTIAAGMKSMEMPKPINDECIPKPWRDGERFVNSFARGRKKRNG